MGSAFRSIGQLANWFNSKEIKRLQDLNFTAVEMYVDRILCESEHQLIFGRTTPLTTGFKVIKVQDLRRAV